MTFAGQDGARLGGEVFHAKVLRAVTLNPLDGPPPTIVIQLPLSGTVSHGEAV